MEIPQSKVGLVVGKGVPAAIGCLVTQLKNRWTQIKNWKGYAQLCTNEQADLSANTKSEDTLRR